MKGKERIIRFKFRAGILLGFMAVAAILFADLSAHSFRQVAGQHETTDSDTENTGSQEVLNSGKTILAHVSQLAMDDAGHFISEIYTVDHQDQELITFEVREFNTWFKTLFRLIISPNAP